MLVTCLDCDRNAHEWILIKDAPGCRPHHHELTQNFLINRLGICDRFIESHIRDGIDTRIHFLDPLDHSSYQFFTSQLINNRSKNRIKSRLVSLS